jgi:hypothetical protein
VSQASGGEVFVKILSFVNISKNTSRRILRYYVIAVIVLTIWVSLGGVMDFQVIFQLTCLALVVISGPVVVFLLVARGGDL